MDSEKLSFGLIGDDKNMFPRKCNQCLGIYKTKNSFSKHEKNCGKKKIEYPRACEVCGRLYATAPSFSRHKKRNCNVNKDNRVIQVLDNQDNCMNGEINDTCERSFQLHTASCIKDRSKYPRACEVCGRLYETAPSFSWHKRNCNVNKDNRVIQVLDKQDNCMNGEINDTCERSFPLHTASCSKDRIKFTHFQCVFDCNFDSFTRITDLGRHLLFDHGVDCVKDISFDSVSSFKQWLENESTTTFTFFKKYRGSLNKNNLIRHYYSCQFYKPWSFKRLTNRRNKKGTIPNYNCPVRIIASEVNEKVRVFYFAQHNHEFNSENCRFHTLRKSICNVFRMKVNQMNHLLDEKNLNSGTKREIMKHIDAIITLASTQNDMRQNTSIEPVNKKK